MTTNEATATTTTPEAEILPPEATGSATQTALALYEQKNVADYFKPNGLEQLLQAVAKEVKSVVSDISTKKGRDEIISRAYKVTKSKTAIDNAGKQVAEDLKKAVKVIDDERKRAREFLDEVAEEVRRPVTQWEEKEKARVQAHEDALAAIAEVDGYGQTETVAELTQRLEYLKTMPARDWEEFTERAATALGSEIVRTERLLAAATKREEEAAELQRLREEAAERKRKDEEKRIADEAAAKATKEAEERAQAEQRRRDEEARQAQEKADREKREAEEREATANREKEAAEARAKKAEEDRLAAEQRAEDERVAAAAREKKAADDAAAAERQRIADEQAEKEREARQREEDEAHKDKINGEVLEALKGAGLSLMDANAALEAIAAGSVPHVKITY